MTTRAQLVWDHRALTVRLWAPSLLALGLCMAPWSASAEDAQAHETVVRQGRYIPTDELVKPKALPRVTPRRVARPTATNSAQASDGIWLFDYISRLIDKEPEAAKRVRTARATVGARAGKGTAVKLASMQPVLLPAPIAPPAPELAAQPPLVGTVVPVKPIDASPVALPVPANPAEPRQQPVAKELPPMPRPVLPVAPNGGSIEASRPVIKGSEIVTGAVASIPNLRPDPAPVVVTPDASQALVQAAERAQARSDLIKLELANRTYDERRLSGQPVFDLRSDWRVLERARDALSGPELAAADAAGFQANAYINEMTRTIVVAVAGSEDLKRDFLQADLWDALIRAQMPQHFFLAKTYIRSVMQRYQMKGFSTECVGHSLGGGACAYAAGELNVRAIVVNPIAAGKLPLGAKFLVTNYVVDGEIANLVYGARGHEFSGDVFRISDSNRESVRMRAVEKFGPLAGPILVIRNLSDSVKGHKIERALDLIAEHAGMERPR